MKISVILPALNEEKNIAKVLKNIKENNNVDEIIVVDNNSTDNTGNIAREMGAKVILCKKRGKGYAMEAGLEVAQGDIVAFVDADICNYKKGFINLLTDPIVNKKADFVKSTFEREGGRVTELVAKPLIDITFPKLSKFDQPLSGIIAGKKRLLKKITFEKDYGVDIGILIDMYLNKAKIKQVNIGHITNDSQDWKSLIGMSKQVSGAILRRANISRKLKISSMEKNGRLNHVL
ncbi:MAG: glycosyltransferase [Bacilli bacterium]|nr:glycosyltransferase [Bacilli bacterium]